MLVPQYAAVFHAHQKIGNPFSSSFFSIPTIIKKYIQEQIFVFGYFQVVPLGQTLSFIIMFFNLFLVACPDDYRGLLPGWSLLRVPKIRIFGSGRNQKQPLNYN
jgi:hypothetical protein